MTRQEWLDLKANEYFKNKEFFPNLTDEDLDEIVCKDIVGQFSNVFKEYQFTQNYYFLTNSASFLREYLDTPITITSGFRSMRKHFEIYEKKGVPKDKIPIGSKHLSLEAFDFRVKDMGKARMLIKRLYKKDNDVKNWLASYFVQLAGNMYFEDFSATPSWIHCQTVPPKSESRFFLP